MTATQAEALPGPSWEAAEGSQTMHLIAPDQPKRRSGPRAACGKYPQRSHTAWFSLPAAEFRPSGIPQHNPYRLQVCWRCLGTLPERTSRRWDE